MKKIIYFALFFGFCITAFAGKPLIGFELNALTTSEATYTGKWTKEIVKNLNGNLTGESDGAFIIGIYEGYQINEYISLIAKQRYFSTKVAADFYFQPMMNFELSKNIVPINIGAKLNLRIDEIFGFYFELLPGFYIIDNFEKGYFGTSHTRDINIGANFGFGGDFVIKDKINISLGFLYEMFEVNQKNIILEDGGEGGGIGISLKVGILF